MKPERITRDELTKIQNWTIEFANKLFAFGDQLKGDPNVSSATMMAYAKLLGDFDEVDDILLEAIDRRYTALCDSRD